MKKLGAVAAVMLVALCAVAATNDVTSVNAVGFIRRMVNDGGWGIIGLPFENLDGSGATTLAEILPDPADQTQAWFYRSGAWVGGQYFTGVGWLPASSGTNEFVRGDALFVKAPGGGGAVEYMVMGEVPDTRSVPTGTTETPMGVGWSLLGYAYPTDMAFTNTTLATAASNLDQVWWWDPAGGGAWAGMQFFTGVGWLGGDVGHVFAASEGLFYNSTIATNWAESKQYVWP